MLIALGASVNVSGQKEPRKIPVEELYVRPSKDVRRETVLEAGEIITSVLIPKPGRGLYSSYRKIRARRSWDFALAGIALALQFDGKRVSKAKVALAGAAPVPWRSREVEEAIIGRSLDPQTIAKAASAAVAQANPLSQNEYKVSLFRAAIQEELERPSPGWHRGLHHGM
jgi:xanthine dehydrogenase YagS FAD-binding subunit